MVVSSGEAATAYTVLFTSGFQAGSTLPSARMAAALLRGRPFSIVNAPPTRTLAPATATAFTSASALGSQPVKLPVAVLKPAARMRCCVDAAVKEPPA
jgi:hypothetical protein